MNARAVGSARRSVHWMRAAMAGLALLLAIGLCPTSAQAADKIDALPTVKNFTSARFDVLVTASINGATDFAFGSGAVQLPDKTQAWIGVNQTDVRTGVVQIGSTFYINEGEGWEQSDGMMVGGLQALPVSEQLAALAEIADGIYRIGDTTVRGQAATQYQIQISGAQVLELLGDISGLDDSARDLISQLSYKYDFWIGPDGTLYQQNTAFSLPASTVEGQEIPAIEFNSLTTYYNFDDPSIAIVAPI